MPKNTRNDGAQRPSKEEDKTSAGETVQPDTAKENQERGNPSDTQKTEEDAAGGEKEDVRAATNDEADKGENSEDEEQYAGKSPAALLEDGKRFFREKNWPQAAEFFSRAVENKVKEMNNADFHPELGTFYLWFGDVLLIKEEQQAELFRFAKQQQSDEAGAGGASVNAQEPSNSSSTSGTAAAADGGGEVATDSAAGESGGGNAAGKVSDEELAFEILEMARKCLAMKLESAVARQQGAATEEEQQVAQQEKAEGEVAGETKKKEVEQPQQQEKKESEKKEAGTAAAAEVSLLPEDEQKRQQQRQQKQQDAGGEKGPAKTERRHGPTTQEENENIAEEIRETVMDLSFAHVRLADMQLMNEKYEEAAQDYAKAVQLRESYGLPQQTIVAPLLCLAQATFFSGRKQEALSLFQRTYTVGCRIKQGALAMPEGMTATALNETLEDLQLQIVDLEKQIQAETAAASATGVQTTVKKGSQCEARECIAKTTASFDAPQLATTSTAPVQVFKISPPPSNTDKSTPSAASSAGDAAPTLAPPTAAADAHKHTVGSDAAEEVAAAGESRPKRRRIDLRTLRGTRQQTKEKK